MDPNKEAESEAPTRSKSSSPDKAPSDANSEKSNAGGTPLEASDLQENTPNRTLSPTPAPDAAPDSVPDPRSKAKRSKTFTGCFTCRSRKVRCDLTKPYCKNCTRARLLCAGYDIKLRWSLPIQFNPKTGNPISSSVSFKRTISSTNPDNNNNSGTSLAEDQTNDSEFFQRRHVGFVIWDEKKNSKPYETYDELDRDLTVIHFSMNDDDIVKRHKTKMIGPFGIFDGSKAPLSKPNDEHIANFGQPNKLRSKRRLKDKQLKHDDYQSTKKRAYNSPSSYHMTMPPSHSPAMQSIIHTPSAGASPHESAMTQHQNHNPLDYSTANDQLWLSNELRDDALLTAAALNGDTQFLEFMNNFAKTNTFPSSATPQPNRFGGSTPSNRSSDHISAGHQQQHVTHTQPNNYINHTNNNYASHNYPNDFLNLVFHRNPNGFPNNAAQQPQLQNVKNPHDNNTIMAMSSLLNVDSNGQNSNKSDKTKSGTSIDPTNQHLYYSNYNNYYYDNPYQLNENLEIHLHASKVASTGNQDEESTDIVEGDSSNTTTMPDSIMSIVQSPLQPKLGFNVSLPTKAAGNGNDNDTVENVGLPTTALQVQPLTRYLLNYYVTSVADLMTVIPLTENPWKTIYFPRALMAIGELSALGQTSVAKNALLNALLAVSAFNLQSKFPKNSDPMKYYLNLGIRLRNQASLFVKKLLGSSSSPADTQSGVDRCIATEKYKDVLCAVMTMISVDLVWGTMQDTNFYIKWCGRVISTKMMNKKKLSSKARILHRIFSSLKLIQDSTCLNYASIKEDFALDYSNPKGSARGYDVNGDKFAGVSSSSVDSQATSQSKSKIDFIVNSGSMGRIVNSITTKDTSPQFVNKKLINTKKNDENFATDALYGLPNSLIVLFSETVQLLRSKIYHQGTFGHKPAHFDDEVKRLSEKLISWKLDWKLYESKPRNSGSEDEDSSDEEYQEHKDDEEERNLKREFFSPMHEVTYHHILSFHHALCIYFIRLIQEKSPSTIQDKVEKTLYHLNSIQKLIVKGEAAIIPLFWQGFIAGCEALSLNLQMGFKKWGADIAQYLGSYWGARQIMLEVWRRKKMRESRADWVSVIQDWEMNLMLN